MDITATGESQGRGKEFGLGRDRRIAITEAIQANIGVIFRTQTQASDSENQQ
ncbi:phage integrase Arm DNA-binding domain-containing protein [Shigella flexneri]|nr:phage integrase Arm DNA-binding domain-containing protein [Shigella flexneri]